MVNKSFTEEENNKEILEMKKHTLQENYERLFGKKQSIKESNLPKFIVPGDVSYYDKHWGDTFKELASPRAIDYGPRESDMYDWNSRANYQAATKEYHTHMTKIAKKLNSIVGELEGSYKVWNKILKKHRNNDGR